MRKFILYILVSFSNLHAFSSTFDRENIFQAYLDGNFQFISEYCKSFNYECTFNPFYYENKKQVKNYLKISRKQTISFEQLILFIDLEAKIHIKCSQECKQIWDASGFVNVFNYQLGDHITDRYLEETKVCDNHKEISLSSFLGDKIIKDSLCFKGSFNIDYICRANKIDTKKNEFYHYFIDFNFQNENFLISSRSDVNNTYFSFQGVFDEYSFCRYYKLNSQSDWVSIPIKIVNGHVFVFVEISGKKFEYLLDTGASFFTIDEKMFEELQFTENVKDLSSSIDLEIANGQLIKAKKIAISNVKLEGIKLGNLLGVVVNPNPYLLGVSLLDKFDKWYIDNNNNSLMVKIKK